MDFRFFTILDIMGCPHGANDIHQASRFGASIAIYCHLLWFNLHDSILGVVGTFISSSRLTVHAYRFRTRTSSCTNTALFYIGRIDLLTRTHMM